MNDLSNLSIQTRGTMIVMIITLSDGEQTEILLTCSQAQRTIEGLSGAIDYIYHDQLGISH